MATLASTQFHPHADEQTGVAGRQLPTATPFPSTQGFHGAQVPSQESS